MSKKFFIGMLISLLLGATFAFIVFNGYKKRQNTADVSAEAKQVYMLQAGAFKSYDNAMDISKTLSTYLVVKENNLYKVIVGISLNEKNINKLKEFYKNKGNNVIVKAKNINNKKLISTIEKYDSLMLVTEDYEMIGKLNKEVLKKYKEVND